MTLQPVERNLEEKIDVLHICQGLWMSHALVARDYAKDVEALLDKWFAPTGIARIIKQKYDRERRAAQ